MQGRGPQKPVVGRRPWGYAGRGPQKWEGGRGDIQGACAEGCVQRGVCRRGCIRGGVSEEVRRKEGRRRRGGGGGGRPGLHLGASQLSFHPELVHLGYQSEERKMFKVQVIR